MKRNHKHADMIRRWLDDDSLEVEWKDCSVWMRIPPDAITWDEECEYRFKPKMIKVNGHEFPEPMRVAPEIGTEYWKPNLDTLGIGYSVINIWKGMPAGVNNLRHGLCHTTREAAEAHARALISLTEIKE